MEINIIIENDVEIASISSSELVITDIQSALDLIGTVHYETGCDRILLSKATICEEFFDLRTKIAGEILQKFVIYQMKVAVYGDFSVYTSKSLKDFIYESNNGRNIFFMNSEKEAIEKLSIN